MGTKPEITICGIEVYVMQNDGVKGVPGCARMGRGVQG